MIFPSKQQACVFVNAWACARAYFRKAKRIIVCDDGLVQWKTAHGFITFVTLLWAARKIF